MKKVLFILMLAILGTGSMNSQSKVKSGVNKNAKSSSVQKKSPRNTVAKKDTGLSQEFLLKNVHGKPYVGTMNFSDYFPTYALVYDVHTLRTSQVVIFNITEKWVQYAIMSAMDRDLIKPGEDRGSLILQNGLAQEQTRPSTRYAFQQDGNVFTFVEEFTKDGKAERINHKFRYDKQTNSFYDMDHNMTLTEYKE